MSARRVWKCHKRGGGCGKQFTVTVGTVMHRTKLPIRYWLFIMFEMMASKNGVAAREIQRKYKIYGKSAWHILHRIREAMGTPIDAEPMEGTVRADETFIGGKSHRMNAKQRESHGIKDGNKEIKFENKTPVLTLMDDTGEVRSRVVNDVSSETLGKHIANTVAKHSTTSRPIRQAHTRRSAKRWSRTNPSTTQETNTAAATSAPTQSNRISRNSSAASTAPTTTAPRCTLTVTSVSSTSAIALAS